MRFSPERAWMIVLLTVFALVIGTFAGGAVADGSGPTIRSAPLQESGDSSAISAHGSAFASSEQAPEEGESPDEGDNNLEEERENLVFLEPYALTQSALSVVLSAPSELLLPHSTEPRGIEKPPRA